MIFTCRNEFVFSERLFTLCRFKFLLLKCYHDVVSGSWYPMALPRNVNS